MTTQLSGTTIEGVASNRYDSWPNICEEGNGYDHITTDLTTLEALIRALGGD